MKVAADRFLAAMRDEVVETKSGSVAVTTSIGAVSAPRYVRTSNDAMARAQEALATTARARSRWLPLHTAKNSDLGAG